MARPCDGKAETLIGPIKPVDDAGLGRNRLNPSRHLYVFSSVFP
jgi:hypothetical protein